MIKHGQKGTKLYKKWEYMKSRCNNKNSQNYRFYGGKGVEVCEEWSKDFMCFKKWSDDNGYIDGLTIDRIDSDKNYEPNNCQWIPMIDNIVRTTSKRRKPIAQYSKDGMLICAFNSVTDASKKLGIAKPNLFTNLNGKSKTSHGFVFKWILDNKDK